MIIAGVVTIVLAVGLATCGLAVRRKTAITSSVEGEPKAGLAASGRR